MHELHVRLGKDRAHGESAAEDKASNRTSHQQVPGRAMIKLRGMLTSHIIGSACKLASGPPGIWNRPSHAP